MSVVQTTQEADSEGSRGKKLGKASEMSQWVKVLTPRPEDLN